MKVSKVSVSRTQPSPSSENSGIFFSGEPDAAARNLARRIRARWPQVKIVMGLWNVPLADLTAARREALRSVLGAWVARAEPLRLLVGLSRRQAAARLDAALGLPVHLVDDEVGWLPCWVERPQDEQRALAHQMASAQGWVVDSAYGAWRDVMLERAQVVIALDYSRALTLSRLVRRCVHRLTTRTPVCNGNTESVRQLFSRNSIVRWHFSSFARKRERMRRWEATPEGVPVLRLTHPREFDRLVQSLEQDNIGAASREAALRHGGIDDLPVPARDDAARFVEF